jgi:hypothetical protein
MKRIISVLLLTVIFACSTSKSKTDHTFNRDITVETAEFGVVQVPILSEGDTLVLNELRFYTITSARDTSSMMSSIYGKSTAKLEGRYQSNLPQMIWKNKGILDNDTLYTISACGTETGTDYFASIAVFDSRNKDCLDSSHPDRQKLIDFFVSKIYKLAN